MQVRQEVVPYISANRADPNFQMAISAGIGIEHLHFLGAAPIAYSSYDHYLQLMSLPATYMGEPEIYAARLKYQRQIHVTIAGTPMPNPATAETDTLHLFYDGASRHYDSLLLQTVAP